MAPREAKIQFVSFLTLSDAVAHTAATAMITTPQRWKSHHRVEAKRRRRANRVAYQAWESIRLPVFTATALGVAAATSYSFHTTLSLVLTPVLYVFLGYLTRCK